mgnify:CR=1 FL=1|jgi:hypothetical protein
MKTSTRLALAATVFAIVTVLYEEDLGSLSLSLIVLAWAFKFILGSLIDKKAEPEE